MRKNHRLIAVLASALVVAGCATDPARFFVVPSPPAMPPTSETDCAVMAALIRTLPPSQDYSAFPTLGVMDGYLSQDGPGPALDVPGPREGRTTGGGVLTCGALVKPCADGVHARWAQCLFFSRPVYGADGQSALISISRGGAGDIYLLHRDAGGWSISRSVGLTRVSVEDVI